MQESTATEAALEAAVAPLVASPERSAVLLDLDGTLAPIVARPEDAAIPDGVAGAARAGRDDLRRWWPS